MDTPKIENGVPKAGDVGYSFSIRCFYGYILTAIDIGNHSHDKKEVSGKPGESPQENYLPNV
jgi:hypothetical protein